MRGRAVGYCLVGVFAAWAAVSFWIRMSRGLDPDLILWDAVIPVASTSIVFVLGTVTHKNLAVGISAAASLAGWFVRSKNRRRDAKVSVSHPSGLAFMLGPFLLPFSFE
jgi:hypothetical protein